MAGSIQDEDTRDGEIHLWQEKGRWIARDVETGVATQGESRSAALTNLDDAVAVRRPTKSSGRRESIRPTTPPAIGNHRTSWTDRWDGGRSPESRSWRSS